jgi:hypothetical protein
MYPSSRPVCPLAVFLVAAWAPFACNGSDDPERSREDPGDAAAGHAAHGGSGTGGSGGGGKAGAGSGGGGSNAGASGRAGNAGQSGAGGGSGSGGSAGGCGGSGPSCTATSDPGGVDCCEYCDFMRRTCASAFPDRNACLTYCESLTDNQLCCRWSYCALPDADQHCDHAGTATTVCQER